MFFFVFLGYEIIVNGEVVGFGGYYDNSESRTICTDDDNIVSRCIFPEYCINNNKLWAYDEHYVTMTSYKSMINSSIIDTDSSNTNSGGNDTSSSNSNSNDYLGISCGGDHACVNSSFQV